MKWLAMLPCVLSLLACGHDLDPPKQPAAVAAITSLRFAEQDGVDLDVFSLYSVRRLRHGHQGVVDRFTTNPHIERVRDALKGKKYWETCYDVTSEELVGAT